MSPRKLGWNFVCRWRSSGGEQLICNQPVGGSTPLASSISSKHLGVRAPGWRDTVGRYPSGQRGQTVNLLADAFGGSNPPLPTIPNMRCGNSSVVERQPSKLGVAGSNPVSRSRERRASGSMSLNPKGMTWAHVAQSAEHVLGKDGVTGSSPVMGSMTRGTVLP